MHKYSRDIEPTATPNGEFTDGNPSGGIARTVFKSYWPNMIQRELLNVLDEADITPKENKFDQLIKAIQHLDSTILTAAKDHSNSNLITAKNYTNSQNTLFSSAPIGQISSGPFIGVPSDWLPLKGGLFSRATYPELWNFISAHYKVMLSDYMRYAYPGNFTIGNGYSNFRLPNMEGLFVRGLGGNSDTLGALQEDAQRRVTGDTITWQNRGTIRATDSVTGAFTAEDGGYSNTKSDWGTHTGNKKMHFDSSKGIHGGSTHIANEVRPANVSWVWLIKAK